MQTPSFQNNQVSFQGPNDVGNYVRANEAFVKNLENQVATMRNDLNKRTNDLRTELQTSITRSQNELKMILQER